MVEISGDHLFVGDYVAQKIYVYSITQLKLENETRYVIDAPAESGLTPNTFGRVLVCKDGENLFVGDPEAKGTYALDSSKVINTGVVFQYKLSGGETPIWTKKTIYPNFSSSKVPNAIDNPYGDVSGGSINLNSKFGQYLDVKEIKKQVNFNWLSVLQIGMTILTLPELDNRTGEYLFIL